MKEEVVISVRTSGALQAERTMGRLDRNVDSTRKSEKDLRKETDRLGRSMDKSASKIKKANKSVDKLRSSVDKTSTSARRFSGLIAGIVSVGSIAMVVRYADAYTLLQKQLKLVTKDTEEMNSVLEELFQISNRTSAQVEASSELYVSLARATRDLNVPAEEMLSTTENILKLVNASGASATSSAAALLQLSQAFNMGALRGQEFRSVLSQTPTLLQAIEEYLKKENLYPGVKIMKLAEEGKLTLDLMRKVYQDAELINRIAGQTDPKTVAQGFQNIRNSLKLLSGRIVEDTGLLKKFIGVLKNLADVILNFANSKFKRAVAGMAGLGAAITGLVLGGKVLIGAAKAIGVGLATIGAGITLGFAGVAAGVGAVGAAAAGAYIYFDEIKEYFGYAKESTEAIKQDMEKIQANGVLIDLMAKGLSGSDLVTGYSGAYKRYKDIGIWMSDMEARATEQRKMLQASREQNKISLKDQLIEANMAVDSIAERKLIETMGIAPAMRPKRKQKAPKAAKEEIKESETLYDRFFNQIRTQSQIVGDVLESTFSSAGNALTQFVQTGKINIRSFFAEIFLNISKLFLQQALLKGLVGILGGGGLGSAASGLFSFLGGSGGASAPPVASSGGFGSAIGAIGGSGLGMAALAGAGGAAAGYFAGRSGDRSGASDGVNIRIVNVVKEEDAEFSTAPATERVIMNIISRNADSVRQIVGG